MGALLALAGLILGSRTTHANDLLQLYRLARTHDATLQAAEFARDAAVQARPEALSQLLPQLSASASAQRERLGAEALASRTTPLVGCTSEITGTLQRCYGDQHGFGLTLSQTIWSLQSYEQLKEADFQAASAQASFLSAQQALLLRVAQAYFAVLSARDELTTYENQRAAFGTLLHQAQVREQTGVGPRSDVEQAQAFYDSTEQPVIQARNALDDAELSLTEITGPYIRGARQLAPLRQTIPLAAPQPATVGAWVRLARQNNPAVRAAELNMEAANRAISAQRGRALPVVSAFGTSTRAWQTPAIGGDRTLDEVGISFSIPLFQGGAVAAAVHQARALYQESEANFAAEQRDIERQARSAYRGVINGIREIAAARRAVQSGQGALEAARRGVEFGTGSEFELLQFQNNYYNSQRAYNQARYNYLTNVLLLKQQAGQLSERDLAMVDGLLVEHSQ